MTQTFRFQIDEEAAGLRLDEFLASRLGWLSRMRIGGLLAEGACAVGGAPARAGYRVRAGDLLEVAVGEGGPPTSMAPEPLPLEIVHEDAHLLVVDKPAGMLVHPTRGVKSGTLANALAYHLNRERIEAARAPAAARDDAGPGQADDFAGRTPAVRPGLAHRLDRATSGLMVIAKTQRALSILSRHFHLRLVEKRYLALVDGAVAGDECVIDAPIGRDPAAHPKWGVSEGGRRAETRLRVLRRGAAVTLVELEPVTGRTNQLRIHCAHAGHPIVGDEWYGSAARARLCLHAARLGFNHPSGGEWMEFASPLPEEIEALANSSEAR